MSTDPRDSWYAFDKQVAFFLERQKQIAEWANLAQQAQASALECLSSLRIGPEEIGAGWEVGEFAYEQQVLGPAVFRPGWCLTTPGVPDVAIALSADCNRIDPAGIWPNTCLPYVGLLCASTDAGVAIKKHFAEQPLGTARLAGMKRGAVWTIYRYIKADEDWWRDLASWRAGIARSFRETAETYGAHIDAATSSVRAR